MYDSVFQILFLGENPSWLRVSHALAQAPEAPLRVLCDQCQCGCPRRSPLDGSDPAAHSVAEIKKAAKSAAELMRHLE